MERWIGLTLTTYPYLEWYRWGRLERDDQELQWLEGRLSTPGGCKRLRRLLKASLPTSLRTARRAG